MCEGPAITRTLLYTTSFNIHKRSNRYWYSVTHASATNSTHVVLVLPAGCSWQDNFDRDFPKAQTHECVGSWPGHLRVLRSGSARVRHRSRYGGYTPSHLLNSKHGGCSTPFASSQLQTRRMLKSARPRLPEVAQAKRSSSRKKEEGRGNVMGKKFWAKNAFGNGHQSCSPS
jgi:hypothetical protein